MTHRKIDAATARAYVAEYESTDGGGWTEHTGHLHDNTEDARTEARECGDGAPQRINAYLNHESGFVPLGRTFPVA